MKRKHIYTILSYYEDSEGKEHEIDVTFSYYPGYPGVKDRFGAPETPDDMPDLEVLEVHDTLSGRGLSLPSDEMERIEAECWEYVGN